MKSIKIKVIPNADKNEVIEEKDRLKIKVVSPPVGGRANKEVIEVLAKFYGVKKKCIRIKKGLKSREKIVEIGED
ncbi:MAG TPA: DUF167 domain-containing protein [Thermoplasmata archaeon]|nr:DUF167 domain-containing protein [Thermoplasmata archaeon]